MADTRIVTATGKDSDGDITSLCGDGTWSPRSTADAIDDINGGSIEYRVNSDTGPVIKVVDGRYLRSTADASSSDNLDNLPDC